MEIVNRRLSLREFEAYLKQFDFGSVLPNKLVIHHTWKPTKEQWQGQRSINGLKAYYERKGWPAGPHLFVAEDGIRLFSTMRKDGIHAGSLNKYSIGIEVVGDYDNQLWSGKTKRNALGAIKALMKKLNLIEENILFHRDASPKSCPGRAITKNWLYGELRIFKSLPAIPGHSTPVPPEPLPTDDEIEIVNTVSVRVPEWAQESVNWVRQHGLFEVRSPDDVRDAVKFHRLYNLITNDE